MSAGRRAPSPSEGYDKMRALGVKEPLDGLAVEDDLSRGFKTEKRNKTADARGGDRRKLW